MSKIKSSKLAISKIAFGILVAGALLIAFACEQKESILTDQSESDPSVKITILDKNLKIDGTAEDIAKLKSIFSDESGFEIVTDSLGNTILVKKEL